MEIPDIVEVYEIHARKFLSTDSSSINMTFLSKATAEKKCADLNKLMPHTYFVKPIALADRSSSGASKEFTDSTVAPMLISRELGKIVGVLESDANVNIDATIYDSIDSLIKYATIEEEHFIKGLIASAEELGTTFTEQEAKEFFKSLEVEGLELFWYEVTVFLDEKEVYTRIVKSKERRTAISNVLVNQYKGDCTHVKAVQVDAEVKTHKKQ